MFNTIMNKLSPMRLVIICGVITILTLVAYKITSKPVITITDTDTPKINLSKVNVVSSQLNYIEDVSGWVYKVTVNSTD